MFTRHNPSTMSLSVHPFTNAITVSASEFPGRMNENKSISSSSSHSIFSAFSFLVTTAIKSIFLLAAILIGLMQFVQVVSGPMCVRTRFAVSALCWDVFICLYDIACEANSIQQNAMQTDNRSYMAAIWNYSLIESKCRKSWELVP